MKQEMFQKAVLKKKPLNKQVNQNSKFLLPQHPSTSDTSSKTKHLDLQIKNQTISPLLNNISLIQASSFISNRQDGSFDSMDKMIIGVQGLENKEEDELEENNSSNAEIIDFTHLHEEYEEVIGKKQMLENENEENQQSDEEYDEEVPSDEAGESFNSNVEKKEKSGKNTKIQIDGRIKKLQQKIQQLRPQKKNSDHSYNSIKFLTANLSQIHEEWENKNNSGRKGKENEDQEEEKELMDFVCKANNEQKIEEKENESFERRNEDGDQDEIVNLLENQLREKREEKKVNVNKQNYQKFLEDLNSKEKEENEFEKVMKKREEWIINSTKSEEWKKKQLKSLEKMKNILQNPFYDDNQDDHYLTS